MAWIHRHDFLQISDQNAVGTPNHVKEERVDGVWGITLHIMTNSKTFGFLNGIAFQAFYQPLTNVGHTNASKIRIGYAPPVNGVFPLMRGVIKFRFVDKGSLVVEREWVLDEK